VLESCGRNDVDVDRGIALASKTFGALRKAVFMDRNLRLTTKRTLYDACVVSVLLYGAEFWTPLRKHVKRLNTFHHRCIRTILGISSRQQWSEHITIEEIRRKWGDEELMAEKVKKRRLEWLGHLARMPDHRLPKCMLFGWLLQSRPRCGPRKRWRDVVHRELKDVGVAEENWYEEAKRSRVGWRRLYREGLQCWREQQTGNTSVFVRDVVCKVCSRKLRRPGDKKRHKCVTGRRKPVNEQRGAVQCEVCLKWFRSKGGLAVRRCSPGV